MDDTPEGWDAAVSAAAAASADVTGVEAEAGGVAASPDCRQLPAKFVPTSYELELLELAKKENVVAYQETGVDKPLVSALLIGDMIASKIATGEKKYCLFVVDRVSRVAKQRGYVEGALGGVATVARFCGDVKVGCWDKARWDAELVGKNTLFLTGQTLLNALRHAVFNFEDVALLVFDEAHHCAKDHPFNLIMKEFYFVALNSDAAVPRIFGMPAWPVSGKVKSVGHAQDFCHDQISLLQRNMNAKVVSATDVDQPEPEEFVVEYCRNRINTVDLGEAVARIVSGVKWATDAESIRSAVKAVAEELGTFASSYIAGNEKYANCPLGEGLDLSTLSPKARGLVDLLLFERRRWSDLPGVGSKFWCIVIVQRRDIAWGLAWILNQAFRTCGDPCLKARLAVGPRASSGGPSALRYSQAKQSATLEAFRDGSFGILVTTSVVEEGLDAPSCGLVVMFNSISSPKVYIQSRSRGRHPKARYVVLLPEEVPNQVSRERANLRTAKVGADAMTVAAKQLKSGGASGSIFTSSELAECSAEPFLVSRTTGARVTATAAVSLLNRFCGTLPGDEYFTQAAQGPRYELDENSNGFFTCSLTLPASSPVSGADCATPQKSKFAAKSLAALTAYRALYERGLLDEHLFPMR